MSKGFVSFENSGVIQKAVSSFTLKDGQTIMVYEPTNTDMISSVTGRNLGKREIVIGVGKIQNGQVVLKNTEGKVIEAKVQSIDTGPFLQRYGYYGKRARRNRRSKGNRLRVKLVED